MIVVAAIRMGDMVSSKDKRLVGFEQPRRSFVLTCFILEVIGVNIKDVLFTFSKSGVCARKHNALNRGNEIS